MRQPLLLDLEILCRESRNGLAIAVLDDDAQANEARIGAECGLRGRLRGDNRSDNGKEIRRHMTQAHERSGEQAGGRRLYPYCDGAERQLRSISTTTGISDTTTIPIATSEKFSLTIGTFPNA